MNFISFLNKAQDPSWWASQTVVCCTSSTYPLLFFSNLLRTLRQHKIGGIQSIDLEEAGQDTTAAHLSSLFLGNRTYFWLKNIGELDAKKRAYWSHFVSTYQGPNCLIVFSDKALSLKPCDNMSSVEIPDPIDQTQASPILTALMPDDARRAAMVLRAIFCSRRKISLDILCLLADYAAVSGADLDLFLTEWLDLLVVPEASLFDLSKYLFARNPTAFFKVWQKVMTNFGELFWVAYWGDIFWRAYHFARLSTAGCHEEAKKFAPRLPFSYIQGGWRQVSLSELRNALNYIYGLDFDIKNGVQGASFIELLYLKFFLRHFDKKQHEQIV
jgi:hypothetical protein